MTSDARFWDKVAEKYARAAVKDPGGYERTLARTAQALEPGFEVVELGCGTGSTALRLAAGVRRYVATDVSAGMIRIAEGKPDAPPSLSFVQASVEEVARRGETFDAVLAFNLLHLVRDLPGTLAAVHGLLRPGGLFLSKTPCIAEMNPLIRLAIPPMRWLGKAPFVQVLSADGLAATIAGAGFTLLAQESHAMAGRDFRPFLLARRNAAA